MRRLEVGAAHETDVLPAEVIGHDEDDIRRLGDGWEQAKAEREDENEVRKFRRRFHQLGGVLFR